MSTDAAEEHLVELISCLEIAGQRGDAQKNLAELINGKRKSCRKTGYEFRRIETDGILEVSFWFPLPELEKVCPVDDESRLEEWLGVISADGIEASLVDDKKMGKCVRIKRLHYIPTDQRDKWISPNTIPTPDFAVLARLLNLRIQQTQGNAEIQCTDEMKHRSE